MSINNKINIFGESLKEKYKYILQKCNHNEDNFYNGRLRNKYYYVDYEIEIIKYIYNNFSNNIKILECGSGICQISLGLSYLNFQCTGTDLSIERIEKAQLLNNELETNVIIKNEDMFNINYDNYDVVIFTNVAGNGIGTLETSENEYNKFINFLNKTHKSIILMPYLFGRWYKVNENNTINKLINNDVLKIDYIYKCDSLGDVIKITKNN